MKLWRVEDAEGQGPYRNTTWFKYRKAFREISRSHVPPHHPNPFYDGLPDGVCAFSSLIKLIEWFGTSLICLYSSKLRIVCYDIDEFVVNKSRRTGQCTVSDDYWWNEKILVKEYKKIPLTITKGGSNGRTKQTSARP